MTLISDCVNARNVLIKGSTQFAAMLTMHFALYQFVMRV